MDSPVDFLLFQLHICNGDQLVQFALGFYDLCLSGGVGATFLLVLMKPGIK